MAESLYDKKAKLDKVSKKVYTPGSPHEEHFGGQNLTKEKLQASLPKSMRSRVTDEIVDMINDLEKDTGILQEYLEEQVLIHMNVLQEIKVPFSAYVNAVKYVALRQNMGITKAYSIVFPEKWDELMEKKANGEQINECQYASAYDKTKAVQLLTKQTLLHASIAYAPSHAKSMRKIEELMDGKAAGGAFVSPKVQLDAAIALEQATRMPEDKTIKVSVSQSEAQAEQQREMNQNISRLVEQMQNGFREGKDVAELQKVHVEIIDAEVD